MALFQRKIMVNAWPDAYSMTRGLGIIPVDKEPKNGSISAQFAEYCTNIYPCNF